jgi:hypothetical protein
VTSTTTTAAAATRQRCINRTWVLCIAQLCRHSIWALLANPVW